MTAATLKATPANMPTIEIGGISYPVFFSILAQEKWAEHVDRPIEEVLSEGWDAAELSAQDFRALLLIALESGEHRRHALDGGGHCVISGELADQALELYHRFELGALLAYAWMLALGGAAEPDPPKTAAEPQAGESFSE